LTGLLGRAAGLAFATSARVPSSDRPCVGGALRRRGRAAAWSGSQGAAVTLDGQSGAGSWWSAGLGVVPWRITVFF